MAEKFHSKELRDFEIKIRNKMHAYAKACLETIQHELRDEIKLNLV
jgi:hypothetical protein